MIKILDTNITIGRKTRPAKEEGSKRKEEARSAVKLKPTTELAFGPQRASRTPSCHFR